MESCKIMVKGIVQYNDRYLLVEKWYDDRIADPYQWEFIDGRLEYGEDPEKGVLRIVEEQTGIQAEVSKPLYTWSYMVGETWNIGIAYHCIATEDEVILSEDLNNHKWVPRDEFERYITNKRMLEDVNKTDLW